jgi:hypothetical protein
MSSDHQLFALEKLVIKKHIMRFLVNILKFYVAHLNADGVTVVLDNAAVKGHCLHDKFAAYGIDASKLSITY